MSQVTPTQNTYQPPAPAAPKTGMDRDGDTDGSGSASPAPAPAPSSTPYVPNPTATTGNHVNTHA